MDYESGTVLFNKAADERLVPASMAKLMTLAVVFDELQQKKLQPTDEFFISEYAWRTGGAPSGGSTMFAELNSKIPVMDLVRSVVIQSGNDAAIALAEGIAGSEPAFATMMNKLATEIGLTGSSFVNSTGCPIRTSTRRRATSRPSRGSSSRSSRSTIRSSRRPSSPGTRSASSTATR